MSSANLRAFPFIRLTLPVLPIALACCIWIVQQQRLTVSTVLGQRSGVAVAARYDQGYPASDLNVVFWNVFRSSARQGGGPGGAISKRFRLAGTFFAVGNAGDETRKAVLDDLQAGVQVIAAEGDSVDGIEVVRILSDRATLRSGVTEEDLVQRFSKDSVASGTGVSRAGVNEGGLVSGNRFDAQRLGEHRWAFSRTGLLNYYKELTAAPERLVKVFDSLKPLYDSNRKITGYELSIEGEKEFFDASGLRERDVVRGVNGLSMTSRKRAEYFISEFANNRASAFVLDVERDGKPLRLTYQIR